MSVVQHSAPPDGMRFDAARELVHMCRVNGIGDARWLQITAGPNTPAGTWTTLQRLVAVDETGNAGAGLAHLVDIMCAATPGLNADAAWASVHARAAWVLANVAVRLVASSNRVVRLQPTMTHLRLDLSSDYPGLCGVHFVKPQLVVCVGDPLAGQPGVSVVERRDLLAIMVGDLIDISTPLVEATRSRASIGRRGLWGSVVDIVASPFANRRATDSGPNQQRERVAAVWEALRGTPLDQRLGWVEFDHEGTKFAVPQTTACCLAYQWPRPADAPPRADGCDPAWDGYCATCPLLPEVESIHRARYWLTHPDG
jgi:hypothetical protein